jgi:L-threonylcarbamoyladenylate synthase
MAAIAGAAAVLRAGGLVAVPTETVYGLAADADNPRAVRAIFEAKGRPADHPVIVHISGVTDLASWAVRVPNSAMALARAFWPGPLTLVLERSARAHDGLTGGQPTVGLRSPAHPWARALLTEFGGALAAPSANRFGRISPTTAEHVRSDLGEKPAGSVDLILNGGSCPLGIESTIVDLTGRAPRLLRPGSITRAQLGTALGFAIEAAIGELADAPRVPGRLEQHYAPRTPLELVPPVRIASRVCELAPQTVAVLAGQLHVPSPNLKLHLDAATTPEPFAHDLYANLHRLDRVGADRILVADPPAGPEWDAIRDRLLKAAAGSANS